MNDILTNKKTMGKKHYCKECRIMCFDNDGSIQKVEDDIYFCSDSCKQVFIERLIDENNQINIIKLDKEDEEERLEEMEREKKASYGIGYEEGYLIGFLDSEKRHNFCPICMEHEINSVHHILPRKFGGITSFDNIICLCNKCHDEVEIKTFELLKKNKFVSKSQLRRYILRGFPDIIEEKTELVSYPFSSELILRYLKYAMRRETVRNPRKRNKQKTKTIPVLMTEKVMTPSMMVANQILARNFVFIERQ